ncbi:MAG: hypothetical protein EAZ97_14635 [Bacteroidetes bacterium]|nr:MAG: hypothetical protein EAZ97_14635 [Bacteroidota bacterium]
MKKSFAISILAIWVGLSTVMMLSSLADPIRWDWKKIFSIETTTNDFDGINAFLTATNVASWSPTVTIPFSTTTAVAGFTFNTANRLEKVELANRKLSGTIPKEIEKWTELKVLNLSNNSLTGGVPSEITKLTKLTNLDLSGNQFTTIPDLSALTALTSVNLANNKLDFGVLELFAGKSAYQISPQQKLNIIAGFQTVVLSEGADFSFVSAIGTVNGKTTLVQLVKDGTALATPTVAVPSITDVKRGTDDGSYLVKLSNSTLAGVTLDYQNIQVLITACELTNNSISIGSKTSVQLCEGDALPLISGTVPVNNLSAKAPTLYQWQQSVDAKTWENLNNPSAANATLQIPFLSANTTYFRRIVTNGRCIASTSNQIEVKYIKKISNNFITTPDQTICVGQPVGAMAATEPAGGTGKPYTYQWQYSTNQTNWTDWGTTQNMDKTPTITNTTYFRRMVLSEGCNFNTADLASNVVKVEVFPNFPSFKIASDQSLCPNTNGTVMAMEFATVFTSVGFTSADLNRFEYEWQASTDSKTWIIADPTKATQREFTPFISANTDYRLQIKGLCGTIISNTVKTTLFTSVTSNIVSLTIGGDNNKTKYCETDFTTVLLSGTEPKGGGGNYTYDWQTSLDNVNWSSQFTSASYLPKMPLSADTYFRRITKSQCYFNTSNVVKLEMIFEFGENTIGNSQQICSNSKIDSLVGNLQKGKGKFTYEWQMSSDSSNWKKVEGFITVPFTSASTAFTSVEMSARRNYLPEKLPVGITYFRRVVKGGCTDKASNIVYIENVAPLAENKITTKSTTICEGDVFATVIATKPIGAGGKYKYEWQTSLDRKDWSRQDTSANLKIPTLNQTTYFRRIVKGSQCAADTSNFITVTVINKITNNRIRDNQELCLGSKIDSLTGSVPKGGQNIDSLFTYSWQSSSDGKIWKSASSKAGFKPATPSVTTQYRRLVSTQGGCFTDTSNTIKLTVKQLVSNNFIVKGRQTICKNSQPDSLIGSTATDGDGVFLYQWQISKDRKTWTNISGAVSKHLRADSPDSTRHYRRIVANTCFSDTSLSESISILPLPFISAGKDTTINIGQSIQLRASGGVSYRWVASPTLAEADSLSATPTVNPRVTTAYTVVGTDSRGCKNTASVVVRVLDIPLVKAVEIITPNGDGMNDKFVIQNLELYPKNTLMIFNRWGKTIYEKVDYENDWDGTSEGSLIPTGTYFFILKVVGTERITKGSFMVIND